MKCQTLYVIICMRNQKKLEYKKIDTDMKNKLVVIEDRGKKGVGYWCITIKIQMLT